MSSEAMISIEVDSNDPKTRFGAIPISMNPSTADYSVFSTSASIACPTTSPSSIPKIRKRSRGTHEGKASQKRKKVMGRPKNGWTASRHRKLVRLYLMTNLEVDEIAKVLRTDGLKTCKRDIQTQLATLLQARPGQIRSKGQFTKQRLCQLRECRRIQPARRTTKHRSYNSMAWRTKEDNDIGIATATQMEEHLPAFPSLPTCSKASYQWFNPEWDTLLFPDEDLVFKEPDVQQNELIERMDSPMILNLLEEIGLDLPPIVLSTNHEDYPARSLDKNYAIPSHGGPPDKPLPSLPTKSSPKSNTPLATSQANGLYASSVVLSETTSESCYTLADTTNLFTATGQSINDQVSTRLRTPRSHTASVASLKKRLSHATENYSPSCLEDIVSLMGHFTISASSSSSIAPSRTSRVAPPIRFAFEYPVVLPGEFPNYCWEHITNNMLHPCSKGQRYREGMICRHMSRKPRQIMNDCLAPYKAFIGPGGEKVDIFGNSPLHIAAALATSFDFLFYLIRSELSVHVLNNADQTFLHLIHPSCVKVGPGEEDLENGICILLRILQARHFNFLQRDHHGRNSLHWLTQIEIPRSVRHKVWKEILDLDIPFPASRDNMGCVFVDQMRVWSEMEPSEQAPLEQELPQASSFIGRLLVADEYTHNCTSNNLIETVGDLHKYAYQADLLRTINESWKNPRYEDSKGRNGLHCLAEVTFDSPILVLGSSIQSINVSPPTTESIRTVKVVQTLEGLLEAGVDPNNYDEEGSTPLMSFIVHLNPGEDDTLTTQTLSRLCNAGADINRRNRQGETCLHLAVKLGRRAATNILLGLGANVHVRESNELGVVALGHKYAQKAKDDISLYAQIMLCTSLVINCGALSTPTIIREWRMRSLMEAPMDYDQVRYKGASWTPLEKLKRYRA